MRILSQAYRVGATARRASGILHDVAKPDYLRVKIRRRLQQLGAVPIKQTVYALPRSAAAQEDFEWLLCVSCCSQNGRELAYFAKLFTRSSSSVAGGRFVKSTSTRT